jgi:methylenetetrahydrofolate--tRNA-(uracil-5-)-methyltransferase
MDSLIIIGGGLAGSEAAFQAGIRGVNVILYEMRPLKFTPAHKTQYLSELVCSNSLRSNTLESAPGLLKKELSLAGSLIMEAAYKTMVPAGSALAVDREAFSKYITDKLVSMPNINIIRQEVSSIPDTLSIIATGPLTSEPLAQQLLKIIGGEHLYFYDAIAPIIDGSSIDYDKTFFSSRYDKGDADYLNCPMERAQFDSFYDALAQADMVTAKEFEDKKIFEGCMPIEVMAQRGRDTMRFGPLKPVGLKSPKTGKIYYAVVQLRAENAARTSFNMVGFQTRLKQPEQCKVFKMIPGLEDARFLRYGSIHRNTFINSPMQLSKGLTLKNHDSTMIAGQITGVEGYIESTAMGLIAGIFAVNILKGGTITQPSQNTAHGALINYITTKARKDFQPSNINFGLFPELEQQIKDKQMKKEAIVKRAIADWRVFLNENAYYRVPASPEN